MKELKYVCAQPDDTYYTWQVHMWLESLKEQGKVQDAIVLIYTPQQRLFNDKWKKIVDLYPEAEFNFYKDEEGELNKLISIYIPILRPWLLWRVLVRASRDEGSLLYSIVILIFYGQTNLI